MTTSLRAQGEQIVRGALRAVLPEVEARLAEELTARGWTISEVSA